MSFFGKLDPTHGKLDPGKIIKQVENAVNQGVHKIEHEAQQGVNKVKKEAESAVKNLPQTVEQALKDGLEEALEEFFKLASKGILSKFFEIAEAAAPDQLWGPTVGPLSFTISNFDKKIGLIRYWAEHPPTNKDKLKKMIGEIKPDTVEITVKANVPGLSLSVGGTLVYNTDTFKDRLEVIWNHVKP